MSSSASALLFRAGKPITNLPTKGWSAPGIVNHTLTFTHRLFPAPDPNGTDFYQVGQQVRVQLTGAVDIANCSLRHTKRQNITCWANFFNTSSGRYGVRVRVVAAHAGRAQSAPGGKLVRCNATKPSDVWFESHDLAVRSLAFGHFMAVKGHATFHVPSFPFQICVQYVPPESEEATWRRRIRNPATFWKQSTFYNETRRTVDVVHPAGRTPFFYWDAPSNVAEHDFGGLRIIRHGWWPLFPYGQTVPGHVQAHGDNVKLVPAGFPCSYDRAGLDNVTATGFCGTNMLHNGGQHGIWISDRCLVEGSVARGAAKVGTRRLNPFVDALSTGFPKIITREHQGVNSSNDMVAYFEFPAAGTYDVCYSPRTWRVEMQSRHDEIATPLWFKIFRWAGNGAFRTSRMIIAARTQTTRLPRFSLTGPAHALSWGSVRIRSPRNDLSAQPAGNWDPKCTAGVDCWKEYYTTTGGDVFRLVPEQQFTAASPAAAIGTLHLKTPEGEPQLAVTPGLVYEQGRVDVRHTGTPMGGSFAANVGCWYADGDNYGATQRQNGMSPCGAACETGDAGPTASSDLTGHPRQRIPSDAVNIATTYAPIRFPASGVFRVCYRRGGTNTWQYLPFDVSNATMVDGVDDVTRQNIRVVPFEHTVLNTTWRMNDTRVDTWGPIEVHNPHGGLTTLRSNYYNLSVADADVEGQIVKLVGDTASCDTGVAYRGVELTDAGLAECPIGVCTDVPCAACPGSNDETSNSRRSVFYYFRVPQATTENLRVCFRAKNNWYHIRRHGDLNRFFGPFRTAPRITHTLTDRRQGSWARLLLRREDNGPINTFPHNTVHGDILRLVPNTTQCDITWNGTSPNFVAANLVTDLGVWCPQSASSGVCANSIIKPRADLINATFPHYDINRFGDALVSTAVAQLVLPAASTQFAYRVCFKQAVGNWMELPPQLRIERPLDVTFWPFRELSGVTLNTKTYIAGSYDFLTIRASSAALATIDLANAIVKLVEANRSCSGPAVGTITSPYESFTIASHRGARLVDYFNENVTSGFVSIAKAYMTLPTLRSVPSVDTATTYRVCFGNRAERLNWIQLGTVSVTMLPIGYAATTRPLSGAAFRILFNAYGSRLLNTTAGGDAFKLVSRRSPCAENTSTLTVPIVTSLHVGRELPTRNVTSFAALSAGVTNLGPGDSTGAASAEATITLPVATGDTYYRVCYRPRSTQVWMEIHQIAAASRPFNLGDGPFVVNYGGVDTVTVSSNVLGQAPRSGMSTYFRFNYTDVAFTGTATTFNTLSIGGANSFTYNFFVSGVGLTTSDELRLVRITTETARGVWTARSSFTCADANVEASYTPIAASSSTVAYFTFNLPMTPGTFLVCYRRSGNTAWIQPAPANRETNPLVVTSHGFYMRPQANFVEVVDVTEFNDGSAFGSLSVQDKMYVMNASGVCGITSTFDGNSTATAGSALTVAAHTWGRVYTTMTVVSPWFPITRAGSFVACYYQAWENTTTDATGATTPPTQAGTWYRIPVFYDNVMQQLYLVNTVASVIEVTCPTAEQVAGAAFQVSVAVKDSNNNVLPSVLPREITAVAVNNGWSFENRAGLCNINNAAAFAVASHNPIIGTDTGTATFDITALSACGPLSNSSCSLRFTSPSIPASAICNFSINTTQTLERLSITRAPTACRIGAACVVEMTPLLPDGSPSYVTTGAAGVTFSTHFGLRFSVNGGADISGGFTSVQFVNGRITLSIVPKFGVIADWAPSTPQYTVSVVFGYGSLSITHSFVVERLSLARIQILDIFAVNWDGTPANDALSNQNSKWEPVATSPDFWNPNVSTLTQNIVNSVPHYPLVAGQYYRVTIVALDQYGMPLLTPELIDPSQAISLRFDATMLTNRIIGQPPSLELSYSYDAPLAEQPFDSVKKSIVFRVKNSENCPRATGCRIRFLFGGRDLLTPTFIQTPVRSRATRIEVACGRGVAESVTPTLSATCPPTTIEVGLSVQLRAVDPWGAVDEFFVGDFFPRFDTTDATNAPTRISNLQLRNTRVNTIRAVNGIALIRDLTLIRPCFNTTCTINFLSDWNLGRTAMPVTFLPSTAGLSCPLTSTREYFLLSPDRTSVLRRFTTSDIASAGNIAIYPDTDLCFTVTAANANGARTFYESTWVHFHVQSLSIRSVTATPSAITPSRYRPLSFSEAEFCFNVNGADGAVFQAVFRAQRFNNPAHWASTNGDCRTPAFTLTTRKFIGGLRISDVSGMSSLPSFPAPSASVWVWKQLTTTTEETELTVRLEPLDHYGKVVNPQLVQGTQNTFYVSIGRCVASDLTGGVCGEGTGVDVDRAVTVRTTLSIAESGILRVALLSSNHPVHNSGINFRIRVRQWCLRCEIPFFIYSGTTRFNDAVNGALTARLFVTALMPQETPRYVAFRAGNSPFLPPAIDRDGFTRAAWPLWQPTDGVRPTTNARPVLFHPSCVDGSSSSCKADSRLFLTPFCASSQPDVLTGNNGADMQLFVVRATVPPQYGEVTCIGDCTFVANAARAQADIFTSYTVSMSIGNQRLRCVGSTPCNNDATQVVSQTIAALGTTVTAAIEALASRQLASTRFRVSGIDASAFYATDPTTGLIEGNVSPSVKGSLLVTADVIGGAAAAVAPLNTTSGLDTNLANYQFVWRAPRPATRFVLLPTATSASCLAPITYPLYDAPPAQSYTGYGATTTLQQLRPGFANTTIPVGFAFPFTLEVRDALNDLVPNATGTITVEKAGWFGCNNGGDVTVVSGDTFTMGRATVWVRFSAPCEQCALRFTLVPSPAQPALYAALLNSDVRRRVVAQPLRVVDYAAGSAQTVFGTHVVASQPGEVTIDSSIALSAAAFTNVGGIALADPAAPIEIAAYVRIITDTRMLIVGNGGVLRMASTPLNFDRHAVRASGVGSAELYYSFQRTCSSCNVLVQWLLPRTGAVGSFPMRNAGGTTFVVSAPSVGSIVFGNVAGILAYTDRHSIAVWTSRSSSTIPFAGFGTAAPSQVTPTLEVVDERSGRGGRLTFNVSAGLTSTIYHIRVEEPCFECRILFGGASVNVVFRAVATHYRITKLTPDVVKIGQEVTIEAYASDDRGYLDATVGGSNRCNFVQPFFCNPGVIPLSIAASQDGVVRDLFYPTASFMSMGGTSAAGFAIQTIGDFYVKGGETPEGGIKFRVLGAPVARCVPIIFDSIGLSSSTYPTYPFHVDLGLEDLQLVNDLPGFDIEIFKTLEIQVAFTKQLVNGTGTRFVAPTADNTIRISFAGECSVRLEDDSYYQRMRRGIARFRFYFFRRNIGQICRVIFTSVTGNVRCSTPSMCSTVAEIKGFERQATSWEFARPSFVENGEGFAGPRFASVGRSQIIVAQLWEKTSVSSIRAQTCGTSGCSIALRPQNCLPVPEVIPQGGARFNENGTATIRIVWKELRDAALNNTLRPYECTLLSSIIGATVDGPPVTVFPVTTCNTARLSLLVNQTRVQDVLDGRLFTGKVYPFEVGMYALDGTRCRGDSQADVSTLISVSAVNSDGTTAADIHVINLNTATAPAAVAGRPFTNDVHLNDGQFQFQVVFSNTTADRRRGPIRLRFTARSASPAISQTVLSPPFEVLPSYTRLDMYPPMPRFVNSLRIYNFTVIVTDAVPRSWLLEQGLQPKVGTTRNDGLFMDFNPSFRRVIPLTFIEGAPLTALQNGTRNFAVRFNLPEGQYSFSVHPAVAGLLPTEQQNVTVQTPMALAIRTLAFQPGAPDVCTTNCTLPSSAFTDQGAFLNSSTGLLFNISVIVADINGFPLLSEDGVEIICAVVTPPDAARPLDVNIAVAPALITRGPLRARLVHGVANFSIGFVGHTGNLTQPHIPVTIQCRTEDPILRRLPIATTKPIRVEGFNETAEMRVALRNAPVIKLPTNLPSLTDFNRTRFLNAIHALLVRGRHTYITSENLRRVVSIVACQVHRDYFGFADLRGSVCGPRNACSSRLTECPPHVWICSCPDQPAATSRHSMHYLQVFGVDVQIEVTLALEFAPGFRATDEAAIQLEYARMTSLLVDAFSNPNNQDFKEFALVHDTVLTTTVLAPSATALPTPAPLNLTEPDTPAPTPAPTDGAGFVSMVLAFALLVLIVV